MTAERPDPPAAMDDLPADVLPSQQVREALGPVYVLADRYAEAQQGVACREVWDAADDAGRNVAVLLAALKGELGGVTRERDRLRAAFATNASDPGLAAVEANGELGEALTAFRAETERLRGQLATEHEAITQLRAGHAEALAAATSSLDRARSAVREFDDYAQRQVIPRGEERRALRRRAGLEES